MALIWLACMVVANDNCGPGSPARTSSGRRSTVAKAEVRHYQVVHTYPHDPNAFTQGLEFHDGKLLESTGEQGRSSLRLVEIESGKVIKEIAVPEPYFAEGATLLNGRVYQLTWQNQLGFIYNYQSFQKLREFAYQGEGWGLTNDGHNLIMSDGSSHLRFIDPETFRVVKTIAVVDDRTPVKELNELEFVGDDIYANIWHDSRVAVIDPLDGHVKAWIDFSGLLAPGEVTDQEAVLNGIAYDQDNARLFVTGKLWPRLFEVKIK